MRSGAAVGRLSVRRLKQGERDFLARLPRE
jgi:hypothetical protein